MIKKEKREQNGLSVLDKEGDERPTHRARERHTLMSLWI